MKRACLLLDAWLTLTLASVLGVSDLRAQPSSGQQVPLFSSGVDLVRVNAVVRDRKGRFIQELTARDFQVLDEGVARPIVDFRREPGAISVALLLDISGSMEGRLRDAREAAGHVLSWLDAVRDEAAIFTFDTRLDEVQPFAKGVQTLPDRLSVLTPFGATSLHDAIARTAERLAEREGLCRAVIVFTDGNDNASRLTPEQVSGIASAIDVPVYIVGIVAAIDNPTSDLSVVKVESSALAGALTNLATWTGGRVAIASTSSDRSVLARQIVAELRHQYFITFESSGRPGWHPLEVHARGKDLTVRARSGYFAGQSRPSPQ